MKISIVTSKQGKQACYQLRHIVFVDEQNVPVELELDEHDETDAIHFLGLAEDRPVATGRIVIMGDVAKIQRVAVAKEYRGHGLGREIMQAMMQHISQTNLAPTIALDAQTYATRFYEDLGFVAQGEEFDDAGIPHVYMRKLA